MKREEAIKILNALAWVQGGPNREEIITAISMAIEALSADVVSRDIYDKRTQTDEKIIDNYRQEFQKVLSAVVRCKDCRFNKHPSNDLCLIKKAGIYPDDDDFCSYGKRREP